jgi:dipeptidyl aminopeptidase/acylaminoacyl peptidase
MLIARDGQVAHVAKPAGLLAWHPSGQLLAFSMNRFMTLFHTIGRNQDVYDGTGDLGVYFVNEATVSVTPKIAETNWFETWPAWPPDGQYLYFCRAPNLPVERFREIRYDLMRIRYDLKTDTWGEVESLLTAQAAGLSIAQPRISPDGKHLMFCMFPYSSFPGTQPASDLYLMDLENRSYRRLDEVNSERSESWHCWSSNGRWFVFSSKRRDGFLTRPYFSYFDSSGKAHKPFLLPQKDPTAYDSTPLMYNLPELVKGPVQVSRRQLFQAVFAPNKIIKPVIDSRLPQSQPQQSDAPRGENTYEQAPPK